MGEAGAADTERLSLAWRRPVGIIVQNGPISPTRLGHLRGSLLIWMADMIGVGATEGGLHQLLSLVPFRPGEHLTQPTGTPMATGR